MLETIYSFLKEEGTIFHQRSVFSSVIVDVCVPNICWLPLGFHRLCPSKFVDDENKIFSSCSYSTWSCLLSFFLLAALIFLHTLFVVSPTLYSLLAARRKVWVWSRSSGPGLGTHSWDLLREFCWLASLPSLRVWCGFSKSPPSIRPLACSRPAARSTWGLASVWRIRSSSGKLRSLSWCAPVSSSCWGRCERFDWAACLKTCSLSPFPARGMPVRGRTAGPRSIPRPARCHSRTRRPVLWGLPARSAFGSGHTRERRARLSLHYLTRSVCLSHLCSRTDHLLWFQPVFLAAPGSAVASPPEPSVLPPCFCLLRPPSSRSPFKNKLSTSPSRSPRLIMAVFRLLSE